MEWLNWLVLLVLVAGHTELMVALVNRVHARPLACRTLRRIRHLHDVAIPGFPILLVWYVGLTGPAVLRGGSWLRMSPAWAVYLGLCAAGAAGLAFSSLRWLLRRSPPELESNHATIIDVAERLGGPPMGNGPLAELLGIPGNQVFELELNEKTLRVPRLPPEWDGLSILHLSDLHYVGTIDRAYFDEVLAAAAGLEADLVVFTGDLIDSMRCLDWIEPTLGRLSAPLGCWFILGNHDWYIDPAAVRDVLLRMGWRDVAGRAEIIEHRGRRLTIAGDETPWMGSPPDFTQAGEAAFRLLLSHTPDNLPWARANGVDLMLSGHNHGGQVVLPVVGPVYAPSRFGVKYAAGTFFEPPTLLHVSRGVSGQHPLRLRCRPEVTRLVLRGAKA
jgi:uncharacterized protein